MGNFALQIDPCSSLILCISPWGVPFPFLLCSFSLSALSSLAPCLFFPHQHHLHLYPFLFFPFLSSAQAGERRSCGGSASAQRRAPAREPVQRAPAQAGPGRRLRRCCGWRMARRARLERVEALLGSGAKAGAGAARGQAAARRGAGGAQAAARRGAGGAQVARAGGGAGVRGRSGAGARRAAAGVDAQARSGIGRAGHGRAGASGATGGVRANGSGAAGGRARAVGVCRRS
jgi:hypothetical protein